MSALPREVYGRWVHAHEEDTADLEVYRPHGSPLPRSRGRRGFEIREDGTFVVHRIAATDGIAEVAGRWDLAGPNEIHATFPGGEAPPLTLRLRDAGADRLRVQRG